LLPFRLGQDIVTSLSPKYQYCSVSVLVHIPQKGLEMETPSVGKGSLRLPALNSDEMNSQDERQEKMRMDTMMG
jgi:hypothetical protein